MPTLFSHALAATAMGQWCRQPQPRRFWVWTVVCAMLPDVDVIGFPLGIRYDDMLGHRGLTHSLAFAALTGAVAAVTHCWGSPDGTVPFPRLPAPLPPDVVRLFRRDHRLPRAARRTHERRPRHRVSRAVQQPPVLLPLASDPGVSNRCGVFLDSGTRRAGQRIALDHAPVGDNCLARADSRQACRPEFAFSGERRRVSVCASAS